MIKQKNNYYNGKPEISDDNFDEIENKLKELDPDNKYFDMVGTTNVPTNSSKAIHQVPMLSMKKVKDSGSAKAWMASSLLKYSHCNESRLELETFNIEPKIDGVSCTIKYNDQGKFICMATRGNGTEGEIVNFGETILKNNNLPRLLYTSGSKDYELLNGSEIELRGEFYIHRTNANKDKPLRNIVAGLISRKELTPEIDNVRICLYAMVNNTSNTFISYGEYFPESVPRDKTIINFSTKATVNTIEKLYEDYNNRVRNELPFETDGLVIYYPHVEQYAIIDSDYKEKAYHHYVLALKPPSKTCITKITGINFAISKYGALVPTISVDPVEISGRTITNFTITNWDNLMNKRIKLNSVISVKFANDIIPCLDEYHESISENEIEFTPPDHCPICNSPVDKLGKNYFCSNQDCKGTLCARIVFINKSANIKGLAESLTFRILNELNINDLSIFYKVLVDDNPQAKNTIGEKTYNKIKTEIFNKLTKLNDAEILAYAANIPSLGLKEIEKEKFNNIYEYFEKIEINPNNAVKRNIVEWLKNKKLYQFLGKYDIILIET